MEKLRLLHHLLTLFCFIQLLHRFGLHEVSLQSGLADFRDGRTRQFGFVGYRTEEEAKDAAKYFHRSFFDTSRLTCEVCELIVEL